jgi:hypothetical protein
MAINEVASTKPSGDWYDVRKKRAAFQRFLKYLRNNKSEIQACIDDDGHARDVFRREGKIDIPEDVKVVLLSEGDSTRGGDIGGSAVIEVPPDSIDPESNEALDFFQCTYKIWSKTSPCPQDSGPK